MHESVLQTYISKKNIDMKWCFWARQTGANCTRFCTQKWTDQLILSSLFGALEKKITTPHEFHHMYNIIKIKGK